jgi:hypothetical protein
MHWPAVNAGMSEITAFRLGSVEQRMAWGLKKRIFGPTQLNIHFIGVSDHEEARLSFFSGLSTFLKRRIGSVDTVQWLLPPSAPERTLQASG